MADGKILFADKDNRWFVKLIGDVRYTISSGFAALLDELPRRPVPEDVVVDLSEAESIDSTNLGLLARIARHMFACCQRKPLMVCPNDDISQELCSMGFDDVFIFLRAPHPLPGELEEIQAVETGPRQTAEMVLEAIAPWPS